MNIGSVPQKGVQDWIKQRLTAVVLIIYLVVIGSLLIAHLPLDFQQWQSTFHPLWVKVFSIIAFLSVVLHAWTGIWTILTDYVHPWRLRFVLMNVVALALIVYFIWFIDIMWRV